ncbi:MAG: lysophospholipid acyltransferase family protein, partial [Thermoanaerobaculia bacterium]|nr:lysophospholipid acyltransferase family protein [Thermoanaerobaculia bacterium]
MKRFLKQLTVRGVFWRRLHHWSVRNVPWYIEPILIFWFAIGFYLGWPPGRRAVQENLRAILPGSNRIANFFRGWRVVHSFSWVMTDTWRFTETGAESDWEVEGREELERLLSTDRGAIILTAHMGNYDLGSYLLTEQIGREMTVVRIPELDPETESFATSRRHRSIHRLNVEYNVGPDSLGLSLLDAIRDGKLVAIQGDRSPPGVAAIVRPLFGIPTPIPAGPFMLGMTARAPIFPLFIVRTGIRRYRVIIHEPIECRRTSRNRNECIESSMTQWLEILEPMI